MIHREDLHSVFTESGEPFKGGRSRETLGIRVPTHVQGGEQSVDEAAREHCFRMARAATLEKSNTTSTSMSHDVVASERATTSMRDDERIAFL